MPEGDTIFRTAQTLHRALAGKVVTRFETVLPKLERVPLVNARANDYLRAGNFAAGLKIIDELLSVVDASELRETKVNLLTKAGRQHEAYELLLVLLEKHHAVFP